MSARHAPGRARTDLSGRSVLLVEDDFSQARDTQQALQHAGARVFGPFPDSESALRCVTHDSFNCAILDLQLRDGTRFGLAEALVERGVPIIFVTGRDLKQIPAHLTEAPVMQKPVDYRSLLRLAATLAGGPKRPAPP